MNVPERACVTAKRLGDRIAARRVSAGRGMAPISPGLAVCRQGRYWNAPTTISSRSCVTAARTRRYGLRRRPLLTRSASRRAKRASAPRDQAGRQRYAPHPEIEALKTRLPPVLLARADRGSGSGLFVDLVSSSCWFINVRPPHWRQTASTRRSTTDLHGPGTCCRRPRPHARSLRRSRGRWSCLTCWACEGCRRWRPMPSHAPRWPGKVASRKPANLTQAVSAPSDCWSTPVWAQPGAQRKGATSDA
jgi:hypothetical protein